MWHQSNSSEKSCPEKSLRGYSTSYITNITLPDRLLLYWAGKRTVAIDSSALFALKQLYLVAQVALIRITWIILS